MSRRKNRKAETGGRLMPDIVPHPRYSASPGRSGVRMSEADIRAAAWQTRRGVVFPESVIVADPEKQNYSLYPRRLYVDTLRTCRECGRPFIFFAREQQHWFEVLKFYVDADCVTCTACRKRTHHVKATLERFSRQMRVPELTHADLRALVEDAILLLDSGVLRNLTRLGALKNRAARQLGNDSATVLLDHAIRAARASVAAGSQDDESMPDRPRG